jgi:hypothetical protein
MPIDVPPVRQCLSRYAQALRDFTERESRRQVASKYFARVHRIAHLAPRLLAYEWSYRKVSLYALRIVGEVSIGIAAADGALQ